VDNLQRNGYDRSDSVDHAHKQASDGHTRMMLVDAGVLPEVFVRVADAKELLATGKASSATEAARIAGISRSAFYKYKDSVFPYDAHRTGKIITVHAELCDQPGILSGVLSAFAAAGANILTVNQNIPAEGKALVSISARIDRLSVPAEEFFRTLSATEGVERVTRVTQEDV
jgi:chorismate mutase